MIWDIEAGRLMRDWPQELAHLTYKDHYPYVIQTTAFEFLPDTPRIAFGSGNAVEIRDPILDSDPVRFQLGDHMYPTELSVREDGQFLCPHVLGQA